MAVETRSLQLTFLTAEGSRATITLNDPRDGITAQDVSEVMDTVIQENIFKTSSGDLVAKDRARLIDRTTTTVFEAND